MKILLTPPPQKDIKNSITFSQSIPVVWDTSLLAFILSTVASISINIYGLTVSSQTIACYTSFASQIISVLHCTSEVQTQVLARFKCTKCIFGFTGCYKLHLSPPVCPPIVSNKFIIRISLKLNKTLTCFIIHKFNTQHTSSCPFLA